MIERVIPIAYEENLPFAEPDYDGESGLWISCHGLLLSRRF